jgi:hypothetical protein
MGSSNGVLVWVSAVSVWRKRALRPSAWPAAIGNGLAAGALGTACMTVSSTLEMKLRERPPSTVPARAAAKVLGVEPVGELERSRFANIVHWSYGTSWGAARGLIGALGFRGPSAAPLFLAGVWGAELVMLPSLNIGVPPVCRWDREEIAIDGLHHLVYATATSVTYELLAERSARAGLCS